MTLQQIFMQGKCLLSQKGNPHLEAMELFTKVFGITRHQLALHGSAEADALLCKRFLALCERCAAGYPVQYLVEQWDFFGLTFAVGEGVLIPRSDTEVAVEEALALLEGIPTPQFADLCSGSGCIAIALCNMLPQASGFAVEYSPDALPYLHQNKLQNHCDNLTVVQADALEWQPPHSLDLIISNPPYITAEDMAILQTEVTFEPRMALFGGDDGLDFYRRLTVSCFSALKPGGWLVFELGYGQFPAVQAMMEQQGFVNIAARMDAAGIPRVIRGGVLATELLSANLRTAHLKVAAADGF